VTSNRADGNEAWLSSEQLAAVLGVNTSWVERRVSSRELPHHRVGRLVRFTPDDVRAIEMSMAVKPTVHVLRTSA
jgi:excisionase family DNA binding protein